MRRFTHGLVPVIAPFVAGFLMIGTSTLSRAQEAAPAAGPISVNTLAPGVTAEVVAASSSALAPGQTVYVARFVFQPGAAIFPHSHPGTTVLGVVSGAFGWTRARLDRSKT